MLRELVFGILRWSGVPFLLRQVFQRHSVTILCYHDPSAATLDRHLVALRRRYNFVPLRHYVAWREGMSTDPMPPNAMIVTFDDGHKRNAELADVLKKHEVVATIFLCSAIVDTGRHFWWTEVQSADEREALKRLTHEERLRRLSGHGFREDREYVEPQALTILEIRRLQSTVDFQAHTRFHPVLPTCSAERATLEIGGSKRELEALLGKEIYALAYPNGDYSDRDADLARTTGYRCALTIDGGYNRRDTEIFRLKRMRMHDSAGVSEALVKASGLWSLFEHILPVTKAGGYSVPSHNHGLRQT
jgi:peptidoglycan/xylan/chitin deacetylase (PgdA/CDA1 family)